MPTPNPQAVEAAVEAITDDQVLCLLDGEGEYVEDPHAIASVALKAAESHIRSQLLTELAEEFGKRQNELEGFARYWEQQVCLGEERTLNQLYRTRCLAMVDLLRNEVLPRCSELAAKEESDE